MKDLKHLIYFENLLDSANNELVQQAKDEGMHPIAYTCYHMPEVVLNVDNCFSVRLRAPKTGSFDIASYYMSNYTCEYCRALVERAIEGGYNFLDAIAGVDACAMIVADRFCFGSTPGREVIELNDTDDVLTQICAHYLKTTQCPRYMSQEKIQERRDTINRLATENGAEGIIYESMKFCDFWAFERALASHIMNEEYGWPVLSIDRPYMARSSGQLRTRLQAFVESLEIKQIHKAAKEDK